MTQGKIASQCSHATLGLYKQLLEVSRKKSDVVTWLEAWESEGESTIALKIQSEKEMYVPYCHSHSHIRIVWFTSLGRSCTPKRYLLVFMRVPLLMLAELKWHEAPKRSCPYLDLVTWLTK